MSLSLPAKDLFLVVVENKIQEVDPTRDWLVVRNAKFGIDHHIRETFAEGTLDQASKIVLVKGHMVHCDVLSYGYLML